MSGSKRRTGYRKKVTESVLHDTPEPIEGFSEVVQILRSQGSNLQEVRGADGTEALAILPTKFRRLVWIKRGDFVIASQSKEGYETAGGSAGRVTFMIEHILYPEQIKHLRTVGKWPAEFEREPVPPGETEATTKIGAVDVDMEAYVDDDALPAMWQNTNKQRRQHASSAESSDESDEHDSDDSPEECGVGETKASVLGGDGAKAATAMG